MDVPDRLRCDEFASLLDSLVSGEVPEAEQCRAEAHRGECPECAARHHFEVAVDREIRAKLGGIEAPRQLKRRIEAVLAAHACATKPDDWRSV